MKLLRTTAFFLAVFVDMVFTKCSDGCQACNSRSDCSACKSSYYLFGGYCLKCPTDCNSCNSYDNCTSCKPNMWGLHARCTFDCNGDCFDSECDDNTGYCTQCKPGSYGLLCQRNCSLCKNGHCDLRSCPNGCEDGYFEHQAGNETSETICLNCPIGCKHCKDGKSCYGCYDGYYMYQIQDTAYCGQCSQGSYCPECIIEGCNECEIQNSLLHCTGCPEGQRFNGEICQSSTSTCSLECSSECDSTGICQGECKNGWTDEKCSTKCSYQQCLKCSKVNGNMCQQCKGEHYLNDCSLVCNQSCIVKNGTYTCRHADGYCLNGCIRNSWGETCNNSCPEGCKDQECDRNNGTCMWGCKEGHISDKFLPTTTINQKVSTEMSMKPSSPKTATEGAQEVMQTKDENNNVIIGASAGGGCLVLFFIIIGGVCLLKRRYFGNKTTQNNSRNVEIPTDTESANNYESLSHNRTRDTVYSDLGTTE